MTSHPLPKREIPDLSQTISKWIESCVPLASHLEKILIVPFSHILKQALKSSQKKLTQMNSQGSWADLCLIDFYLSNRLSLSFFSNVFYLFEDDPNCQSGIDRASSLIASALQFHQKIKADNLEPDNLDHEQYAYLFSTGRIPGDTKDKIKKWDNQSHVVIAVLGQFYKLDFKNNLLEISVHKLKKTLQLIIQNARLSKPEITIGLLTALPRSRWSKIYEQLDSDPINSALLFVAIDLESFPTNRQEKVNLISHQNPENRWYDKSHQIIVSENGKAGINRDHTLVDGHPTATYVSEVFQTALDLAKQQRETETPQQEPYHFEKLYWKNTKNLKKEIRQAQNFIQNELNQRELISFNIENIGSDFFDSYSVSSDAAVQIAIQMAAYAYFGKLVSVSEAIHMRHFAQGRYDSIWCVTQASKKFIQAQARQKTNLKLLRDLFEKAIIAHKKLIKDCKLGESPVLHLSALTSLSKFSKFSKLVDCTITTSHPGHKLGYELGGFTDTSHSVIGINYLITPTQIQVYIKTDHRYFGSAEILKNNLIASLFKIRKILAP